MSKEAEEAFSFCLIFYINNKNPYIVKITLTYAIKSFDECTFLYNHNYNHSVEKYHHCKNLPSPLFAFSWGPLIYSSTLVVHFPECLMNGII